MQRPVSASPRSWGAGHIPQVTHAGAYVEMLAAFIREHAAAR